jgi:hypothetical protein
MMYSTILINGLIVWAIVRPVSFGAWARKVHQAFHGNIK